MLNLTYKIILENTNIKYTNIHNCIDTQQKEKLLGHSINITLTKKKTNGTLYVVHTEKKNKYNNIVYKNITVNIDSNMVFKIVNVFIRNNHSTIFYTKLNILLNDNTKVDSFIVNNTRNYLKTKNKVDNSSKLAYYVVNNGDIYKTTVNNELYKNSCLNFFAILQTKPNQTNFFNVKTAHINNNSYSNHVCRIVAENNTKTTIKATVTVNKNITNTQSDTNCKTLTVGETSENTFMPFLKIYNNEIKCTHSASVGCVEKELIYYMQTRGLHKDKAYKIIANSFTKELLKKIKNIKLYNYLQKRCLY